MKPVKIALLVIGPFALLGGVYLSTRDGVDTTGTVTVVDIRTGQIESLRGKRLTGLPAANQAGEYVLYPVNKEQDGGYTVSEAYREMLVQGFGKDPSVKVDMESFRVTVSN